MSLMREIRQFPVKKGTVALWWLGQNGYLFKSHEGTLLATDLYLTDSVARRVRSLPAWTCTGRCPC